jgi:hypothetical protein
MKTVYSMEEAILLLRKIMVNVHSQQREQDKATKLAATFSFHANAFTTIETLQSIEAIIDFLCETSGEVTEKVFEVETEFVEET